MSVEQLLEELQHLNRKDKFRVLQTLVSDLAREEVSAESLLSGTEYEVWSPFDAYEAAETLQSMLDEHRRKDDNA